MDRRDKREIEALKQTIEDLMRQLEGSRNKSEVAVAMGLEGSGPAIKALQREVRDLQDQVLSAIFPFHRCPRAHVYCTGGHPHA